MVEAVQAGPARSLASNAPSRDTSLPTVRIKTALVAIPPIPTREVDAEDAGGEEVRLGAEGQGEERVVANLQCSMHSQMQTSMTTIAMIRIWTTSISNLLCLDRFMLLSSVEKSSAISLLFFRVPTL